MKNRVIFSEDFNKLSEKEMQLTEQAASLTKKFVEVSAKYSGTNRRTRGAHAKRYAEIHGTLKINGVADANFKGIFKQKDYTAVIRFSNASMKADDTKDASPAYGLAIKLLNFEDGKEFNLPLVNFPVFPTNSVSRFLELFIALNRYRIRSIKYGIASAFSLPGLALKGGSLLPDFFKGDVFKKMMGTAIHRDQNPLAFSYHSVGCYRMGDYIVKFMLEAQKEKFLKQNLGSKTQKQLLEEMFTKHHLVFSLKMQYCRNEELVNDLTQLWPRKKYIEVGKITVPAGSFLDAEKSESLSYNPFENPEILKPVGRLQATREKIYHESVTNRRLNTPRK